MINTKLIYSKRGMGSLAQVMLLVVGIMAIAWAIGSEVGVVSGEGVQCPESMQKFTWEGAVQDYIYCFDANENVAYKYNSQTQRVATYRYDNPQRKWYYGEKMMSKEFENAINEIKSKKGSPTTATSTISDVPALVSSPINLNDVDSRFPVGTQIKDSRGRVGQVVGYDYDNNQPYVQWKEGDDWSDSESISTDYLSVIGDKNKPTEKLNNWWKISKKTLGVLGESAIWAIGTWGTLQVFMTALSGVSDDVAQAKDYLSIAGMAGMFAGKSLYESGLLSKGLSTGVGLAVTALIFIATYKKEKVEMISYQYHPWQAPVGGSQCELCNKQGDLPCSEYQCRSLGQACQLLNKGQSNELCAWVNKNDVTPPTIEPWEDALQNNFKYTPDKAISPPDRGVKLQYTKSKDTCIPAFTAFSFGIKLNEPAQCKIDFQRKRHFENMSAYFGDSSLFRYNHTHTMSLPGPKALESENITLKNDGKFNLFVRCQDANGNQNEATFVFTYCMDKGPDTEPPVIMRTDPLNGAPVRYNISSVPVQIYTNEPAECRWSHIDKSYEDMEYNITCSRSVLEMNAQLMYRCEGVLEGIKDREENKFYFRCLDKPLATEDRIANKQSYVYTLIGTEPLVIDEITPNNTIIKDSTDSVKVTIEVKTSAGYQEGNSSCYYSETGEAGTYIKFLNSESYTHTQDLWLPEGTYTYYIQCTDLGGNTDNATITFTTESDSTSPLIARAYHESTYLKIITTENASCVYGTDEEQACNYLFEDGLEMTTFEDIEHYTDWAENTNFYIKCKDNFGNRPLPNECSIIVRAFRGY